MPEYGAQNPGDDFSVLVFDSPKHAPSRSHTQMFVDQRAALGGGRAAINADDDRVRADFAGDGLFGVSAFGAELTD